MTQQTPWMERRFSFDFTIGLFPIIFSRLEGTIFRLHHLLANADDERCSIATDGWSVKQQIGHLYDMEELWWQRLHDYLKERQMLTTADLSNAKTHNGNHNEATLELLANRFLVERQKLLEAIYTLNASELSQTAIHPRLQQSMRLIDALYFVAEHDDHHLAAVSMLLRKPVS